MGKEILTSWSMGEKMLVGGNAWYLNSDDDGEKKVHTQTIHLETSYAIHVWLTLAYMTVMSLVNTGWAKVTKLLEPESYFIYQI